MRVGVAVMWVGVVLLYSPLIVLLGLFLAHLAVKLAPTNTSLLWRKATLLSELNEPRKALETLQILVNVSVHVIVCPLRLLTSTGRRYGRYCYTV